MADTIRGRQMMIALLLGLPPDMLPDEKKVQAEALAWIRFQEQFPKVRLSAKADAIIGLAAASCASYLPMVVVGIAKTAEMRRAKMARKPGFDIPAVNPAMGHNGGPPIDGEQPPARRPGLAGEEIVLHSGVVPDGGTLKFN